MTDSTKKWYDRKGLVVVLCIFFFPVGLYALWKSNVFSKGWQIVITAFIALCIILNIASKKDVKSISVTPSISNHGEWKEVFSFKGNGMKKSSAFNLSTGSVRLKYKYKGSQNGGLFSAYVFEEGHDIIKEGGIPDIMTEKSEEGETSIQKFAGSYYIYVNAIGDWSVSIEERE